MNSLLSFSKRCVDALLWSLGLSSVVVILMLGFYMCWTQPLTKTNTVVISEKAVKEQPTQPVQKAVAPVLEKHSVFAGM